MKQEEKKSLRWAIGLATTCLIVILGWAVSVTRVHFIGVSSAVAKANTYTDKEVLRVEGRIIRVEERAQKSLDSLGAQFILIDSKLDRLIENKKTP